MADLETTSEELKEDKKTLETDQTSSQLDNFIGEDTGSLDNEINSENDNGQEDEIQTEEKEDNNLDDKVPDIKIDGDKLVSSEDNVSVDLKEELPKNDTNNLSGMQVTEEEKDGVNDAAKNPSNIFETNTGAAQFLNEDKKDVNEPADSDSDKSASNSSETSAFDKNTNTGASRVLSKPKKILFSTIAGLKRAKKSVGNFFTKKLPQAFKSGAKATKDFLKKTPLAPVVSLIDKAIEKREASRPERELKARLEKEWENQKKAKWLLDQDEKKRKKEEEARIKKEKEELEAKAKAALEEAEKAENSLSYRTKSFFKKIWNGIKTGATAVGRRIRDSKFGQATAKVATKTIVAVKGLVEAAKAKIGGVLDKVVGTIDQMKDEYDEFSFEDRMKRITEEENTKKQKGEYVPKEDYRTRYLALTAELKVKLASIRDNITRREEIETALSEMEGMSSSTVELKGDSKEQIKREDWEGEDTSLTWKEDVSDIAIESGIGLLAGKDPLGALVVSLSKIGTDSSRVDKFKNRKKLMDAINSTSKNELIKRMSKYAKSDAELKEMQAGFNVALDILNAAQNAGKITGMAALTGGAKLAGQVTSGVMMLATSSKRRSSVKEGIKDMIGGKEGYYALKAKYKMHAPEMRRAVRDALGVATSEDAVTADKWELSHLMHERTKEGPMDIETERMVAEAGGTTEKKFDALMGAGAKIRRRNADRRLRMTA